LQIEYALVSRSPETKIFPLLDELGIAATTYGALSRGLLSGSLPSGAGDMRAHLPRFKGEKPRRQPATCRSAPHDRSIQKHHARAVGHRLGPG